MFFLRNFLSHCNGIYVNQPYQNVGEIIIVGGAINKGKDTHLKRGDFRNVSRNWIWRMSKNVILLRISVTSAAIIGATFCLTVMAIFFVFVHFSGSSYNKHTHNST
jgi:hypothetical protein